MKSPKLTPVRTPVTQSSTASSASRPVVDEATRVAQSLIHELKLKKPPVLQGWTELCGHRDVVVPAMTAFRDPNRTRAPLERTHLFDLILFSYEDAMVQHEEDNAPLPVSVNAFRDFVLEHPEHANLTRVFLSGPLGRLLKAGPQTELL